MGSRCLFLLVYMLGCCCGALKAQGNAACSSLDTCGQGPDPTSAFLRCVGLSSNATGRVHMQRLKGILEATLDVYTFLRSSWRGLPVLTLRGEVDMNTDPLQNEDLVLVWLEVNIKPLITSISKHFLLCLGTKSFSCSTYQAVVRKLSYYYSEMDPVRQKWTYTFFMYPFLSGDRVAGCVDPQQGSDEWLLRNFGEFRTEARVKDFWTLNVNFSGLDVLHLLSGAQKAELLLTPELADYDNASLAVVFNSLATLGSGVNWTSPGFPPSNLTGSISGPYSAPAPQSGVRQVLDGFMAAFRPIRSFVHEFVSLAQTTNVSEIRSTTLTQMLLNWTLAELADALDQRPAAPEAPTFNVANVEDWYQQVVMPVLMRFWPNEGALMHRDIRDSFEQLFFLDNNNETSEIVDVCSITLDKTPCGVTNAVENLARVLDCGARSNLTLSETTTLRLLVTLTAHLNSLIGEFTSGHFAEVASDFRQIFGQAHSPALTEQHMDDPNFIRLWFQVKLTPLLPDVPPALLSCLSTKNFSCLVYQTIVAALSEDMRFRNADVMYSQNVYEYFIHPFTLRQLNSSDPQCFTSANQSAEWLVKNFGFFSRFASVVDFYELNPNFSGLQVLDLLTSKQIAELILRSDNNVIIQVFSFLVQSPQNFPDVLYFLVQLAPELNPTCDTYKQIFTQLDLAMATVPLQVASVIASSKVNISQDIPLGCSIYGGQCFAVPANRTSVCAGVNSTTLQLHLDAGPIAERFCDFAVEQFACASLSALTAADLAAVVACESSGSRPAWELLLGGASLVLDGALDILSSQMLDPNDPAVSVILDTIQEIRLEAVDLNDPFAVDLWFGDRLRPFLPAASPNFLSCLAMQVTKCPSYRIILQHLSSIQPNMTLARQVLVYTHFIRLFLTRNNTADPSCLSLNMSSAEWIRADLGAFSAVVPFQDLQLLDPQFVALDALSELAPRQLAALAATPGLLTSPAQVQMVIRHVPNRLLPTFFDDLSSITGREGSLPSVVRSTLLQVVFDRVNLSDPSVSDATVSQWLQSRLPPLLPDLAPGQVGPFFQILEGRNCSVQRQGIQDLNSVISTLSDETKTNIYTSIFQMLKEPPPPLRCYGNNPSSFYRFLELWFLGFQFPTLSGFLALIPPGRTSELVNSLSPSDVGAFLGRPGAVDDVSLLCVFYDYYNRTPVVLQTVSLPVAVMRMTLPCVWPTALGASTEFDVSVWFDGLRNYTVFLNRSLIGPAFTQNASCLAFQKFVSVLSSYDYTNADFTMMDVYDSIRAYLTLPASVTEPRCYNPNDPDLNSTAWFAKYMYIFMNFLTLDVLNTLGSPQVIQMFTVNLLDVNLLFRVTLAANLTSYYTQLVYQQDSNFNPSLLPLQFQCFAPGPAFTQLTPNESILILHNLTMVCTNLDPQISAALASNLGNNIDAAALVAMGNQSTSLSTGQIRATNPIYLFQALSTLSTVQGWEESQAWAIVEALRSSGLIQVNSSSSLLTLGSLVIGVPSGVFSSISGLQLIQASATPLFLTNLVSGPPVIQETFVTQIVAVNTNSEVIIQNVPDHLATEVPRDLLLGFSSVSSVLTTLNRKTWRSEQVALFFDVIGDASATAALGGPNSLSSYVLQGFTCTGVRSMQTTQVQSLVRASRRSGASRVRLQETQLTCMYNYIKGSSDVTNFTVYPPDVMLYYDYSLVPPASCGSYFQQLGNANFFVFSSTLSFYVTNLFANARSCLSITNTTLTKDNILVLGNMCCTLNGSYIQNSDPYILEALKSCPGLSPAQAAAAQSLLLSGSTPYGAPSTWNRQTLLNLGVLPLYMTSAFYKYFDLKTKKQFLNYFLTNNKLSLQAKQQLWEQISLSITSRSKRSTVSNCTVGAITQVTISDVTFPFSYSDINQFNACLSAAVVRDNLESITQKVVQPNYLIVVLNKLQQAYGASAVIPEDQVMVLGPASRVATVGSIGLWSITQIDTLSALMSPTDGPWDPTLANAVISNYLSNPGNSLGSAELNAVGANLCSLNASVLTSVSPQSLRQAGALNVSGCAAQQQAALFGVALQAFTGTTRAASTVSSYQLLQPYMGGAVLSYVQSLFGANVNMDLATFSSMPPSVVLSLTVSQVVSLLGAHLPLLKAYENQTLVQSWIRSQPQSQLDSLGLGLVGGTATATTAGPSSSSTTATNAASGLTTTSSSSSTTTTTTTATGTTTTTGISTTTASTTKGHGSRIHAHAGLSFLSLLTLFILSQRVAV